MVKTGIPQEDETALAAALSDLWESAHGAPPGRLRILVGPDRVAAWIEGAFSLAEQSVVKNTDAQLLLHRYAEQLLAAIDAELRSQVEAIIGRRVVSTSVHADVNTDHVSCLFILGEPIAMAGEGEPGRTCRD